MMGLDMYIDKVEGKFEDLINKYGGDEICKFEHFYYNPHELNYWDFYKTEPMISDEDIENVKSFLKARREEVAYWRKDYELNEKIISTIHDNSFDSNGTELLLTKEKIEKLCRETEDIQLKRVLDTTDFEKYTLLYTESY